MISVLKGNLLEARNANGPTVLCHQVNCKGVMGAGVAKAIRERWPLVFERYQEWCKDELPLLGEFQPICVENGDKPNSLWVVNIFGQDGHGSGRQTNYGAVAKSFNKLAVWHEKHHSDARIYIPYLMGCGLAGGDWEVYSEIVEFFLPNVVAVEL